MEYLDLIKSFFSGLGGVGFLAGVLIVWKTGLLKDIIDIKKNGKNGNGSHLEEPFKQLAETANHNLTKLTEKFAEHTESDAREFGKSEEFRQEVRDFMRDSRIK